MKEIIEEKVVKQTVGYEAIDGRRFASKEECEKYEKSAEHVILSDFNAITVGEQFAECHIFENYGYGSEEFMMAVVDIRNADCLEIANRYLAMRKNELIKPDAIGKKVLINIGYEYEKESHIPANPKTMDQLVQQFIKDISKYYGEEYNLPVNITTLPAVIDIAIGEYDSGVTDAEDLVNVLKEIKNMLRKEN